PESYGLGDDHHPPAMSGRGMMTTIRQVAVGLGLAALAAVPPRAVVAQGREAVAVIGAPSVTAFGFGSGATKRTVSQTAVPFVVLLPINARLSVDLSTAFATSEVAVSGAAVSTISGLTDTQVRGNYALGESVLLTAGVNLPTGRYLIPADQQEAAGQIGNDFLNYGISSMGNGLALTGGVAYARPIGDWNLGLGTSLRKATRFDAFEVEEGPLRFTPSDEVRLRVGVDRPVGDGQIELGLSYSAFGADVANTTTYSTGDRVIATAGWSVPVRGVQTYLSAWNLFRLAGEQLGGPAPGENVFNLAGGASLEVGGVLVQPSAELRLWQVDGVKAGNLVSVGIRARLGLGAFAVYPSVGLSTGALFSTADGTETSLTGFRGGLTVRWR
ncbi:MAG: hypothetical protein RI891_406, partial [Gemmatimonadota bacterium]